MNTSMNMGDQETSPLPLAEAAMGTIGRLMEDGHPVVCAFSAGKGSLFDFEDAEQPQTRERCKA